MFWNSAPVCAHVNRGLATHASVGHADADAHIGGCADYGWSRCLTLLRMRILARASACGLCKRIRIRMSYARMPHTHALLTLTLWRIP